uniref:RNase H type-1 domain-containing protein n=1 Tax=Setaria viridis TaxID=4556 RepID=A0A4U6UUE7_SETVI|nr:hypothetical protein SEVIR_5G420100v2 [Setaria viridis]
MGLGEKIQQIIDTDLSGSVILEEVITNEDQVQALGVGFAELVLMAGWYIWWERRQFVHGETVQNIPRSAMAITALTKNYMLAARKVVKVRQGWKKPPVGKVMVNVDAGFDENGGCGSVGSVIRDCSGGFLAAAHSFVLHLVDAQMAEAYALKEGLMLAQRIGPLGNLAFVELEPGYRPLFRRASQATRNFGRLHQGTLGIQLPHYT